MHSKYFAPSSFSRRVVCHGSAFLEEMAIAEHGDTSSPAAERGTAGHSISEQWIRTSRPPVKAWMQLHVPGYDLDKQLFEQVQISVNNARRLLRKYKDGEARLEEKLSMDGWGVTDMFGTGDLIIDEMFGTLVVFDHKFGSLPVFPDSIQLKCYALMAAGSEQALMSYKNIVLAISQPARPGKGGDSLHIHEMKPIELMDWYIDVVKPTVQAITDKDTTLVPTEDGCRWCKAKSFCDAHNDHVMDIAKLDFQKEITTPKITPELIAKAYPHLKMLETWIKDVKEEAMNLAQAGKFTGFKVVAGRGRRAWIDDTAAAEVIKAAGHNPYEEKLLTPAKAEKLKGVKAKIKGIIESIPGSPTVAPESDKRKAIVADAAEDFKDVD